MTAISFLPMYDIQGTREHADALWNSLRDAILEAGLDAPDKTERGIDRMQGWLDPRLVLGQTCGLPYITQLCNVVELVGTPDYGVEGCPPGFYHSTLIAAAGDVRSQLSDFLGATLALNGMDSQSGYGAIMAAAAPLARDGRFFGRAINTGSHKASMELVASGQADIAAIDSVTWQMSRRFDSSAADLRAIGTTDPTPGLPFITASGNPPQILFDAVARGIDRVPQSARDAFGLKELVQLRRSDYDVIRTRLMQAELMHSLPDIEYSSRAGQAQ